MAKTPPDKSDQPKQLVRYGDVQKAEIDPDDPTEEVEGDPSDRKGRWIKDGKAVVRKP